MVAVDDNSFTGERGKSVRRRGPLSHRHQDRLFDFCDAVFIGLATIDQHDGLAIIIGVTALVFIVIASIKANDGVAYRYPFSVRLVK